MANAATPLDEVFEQCRDMDASLTERLSTYSGVLPDTITIYRDVLLDVCDTEADVVDEVVITVIHEIAHHFGIDDERLHELGWG